MKVKQQVRKMASLAEIDDVGHVRMQPHRQPYHLRKRIVSAGWVCPTWVSWSRWFKRGRGAYPGEGYPGILVDLAHIPKSLRDEVILPKLMKMERSSQLILKKIWSG